MNLARYTHLSIARVIVETRTPLSVLSGHPEGTFDSSLQRDANGLPMIPGTALAGVLRNLVDRVSPSDANAGSADPAESYDGKTTAERLFGYASRQDGLTDLQPSRISLSHGCLLDSQQQAIEGLQPQLAQSDDPVVQDALRAGLRSHRRERVRISHRGAADDSGLFDRAILTAGHRFAFEMQFEHRGQPQQLADWDLLCHLLGHPLFRLGGGTRSGLGGLRIVRVSRQVLDLRQNPTAFATLNASLSDHQGLTEAFQPDPPSDPWLAELHVHLRSPRGFWRIGTGSKPLGHYTENPPQLLPRRERRLCWESGQPEFVDALLVAATALKGPIAHRTAFHANCLSEVWAEDSQTDETYDKADHNPTVQWLFGSAKNDRTGLESGLAGRVIMDDQFLSFGTQGAITPDDLAHLHHNSIDRFTGGVRAQVLFGEEVLARGELDLPIWVDTRPGPVTAPPPAWPALHEALQDLVTGHLAIGAGASQGHGVFEGQLDWPEDDLHTTLPEESLA